MGGAAAAFRTANTARTALSMLRKMENVRVKTGKRITNTLFCLKRKPFLLPSPASRISGTPYLIDEISVDNLTSSIN